MKNLTPSLLFSVSPWFVCSILQGLSQQAESLFDATFKMPHFNERLLFGDFSLSMSLSFSMSMVAAMALDLTVPMDVKALVAEYNFDMSMSPAPEPPSLPSPAPVFATPVPVLPTLSPTTAAPANTCKTAFVYCAQISTCNNTTGGWSIDIEPADLSLKRITCDLYTGAETCNFAAATWVGQVQIAANSVTFNLTKGYGGKDFAVTASSCPASGCLDKTILSGLTLESGPAGPLQTLYSFDKTNEAATLVKAASSNITVFPLKAPRRYVSATSSVCPCKECALAANKVESSSQLGTVTGSTTMPAATASLIGVAAAVVLLGVVAYQRKLARQSSQPSLPDDNSMQSSWNTHWTPLINQRA
jgi:hypothetical protein